jgi:hypothetical protein
MKVSSIFAILVLLPSLVAGCQATAPTPLSPTAASSPTIEIPVPTELPTEVSIPTPTPPIPTPTPPAPPPPRQPATHTVCATGCAYTTIQAALDDPATLDGAVIEVVDAVHTEAGIVVSKGITLQGPEAGGTIVQAYPEPTGATARVLHIVPGVRVVLRDLTIRYGHPSTAAYTGGGIWNQGNLVLVDVTVSHNTAADGGGIWNQGVLTATHCTIADNVSNGAGDPYIECGSGGGIKNTDGAVLTLVDTVVKDNQAEDKAGGIHVACYSTATLILSTVTGNQSVDRGGGIFIGQFGLLRLIDSAVQGNRSGKGGLYVRGTLEYVNSDLSGCIIGGEGDYRGRGTVHILNDPEAEDTQCR